MHKSKKIIGVCVSQLHDITTSVLVKYISKYVHQNHFRLLIYGCFTKMDVATPFSRGEASVFSNIPMEQLSGLVLLGQTILDRELLEGLRNQALQVGIPVVTVDYELEGCYNIQPDYNSPSESLVRHVVEHHHCKNPFFLAGFRGNEFSEARIRVYKQVLQENGISVREEHIAYGDFWEAPARAACEKWLENKDDIPDAIICANDVMALTVCNALEEHGFRVPQDVIVTGFDGIDLIQYCTPRLTTAQMDHEGIVQQMMKIFKEAMGHPEKKPYSVLVPFHLCRSESCGCEPLTLLTSNQYVIEVYEQMANYRSHVSHTFRMMTKLTEGHSMMDMLRNLHDYVAEMTEGDLFLFVNSQFCRHTDIPVPENFGNGDTLLLLEQSYGKYAIPLLEMENKSIEQIPEQIWRGSGQILLLPLHWQDEEYGYMALQYFQESFDYERLNDFMMTLAQILGTMRKQSQLHEMYIRDALTSLYNRRGFYVELEARMKALGDSPKKIFLASVDMDRLKYINDNYGHGEGDVAINALGEILERSMEEDGFCARFGGDEFVAACLWEADRARTDYPDVFQVNLNRLIQQWNQREQKEYQLGASCGTVLEDINDEGEIDGVMKLADDAMYHCKSRHHSIRGSQRDV